MINTDELRRHNLIEYLGKVYAVDGLNKSSIFINDMIIDGKVLNPIPLTPEWLERCGLGKRYWNSDKDLKLEIYENKAYIGNNFSTNASIVHNINYLHQLQNLFFDITGEELTINNEAVTIN